MKPTYKQIWLITYPILISLLMENLIGLTDTAFRAASEKWNWALRRSRESITWLFS